MIRLSWATFRERWPLFVGAIVAVAVGVALVQASLLTLISAATPSIATGLPHDQELLLRDGYDGAVSLAGMMTGISAFVAVFIVASTFAFTVAQRRRDLALLRLIGATRRQVRRLMFGEALVLGTLGSSAGILLGRPRRSGRGAAARQAGSRSRGLPRRMAVLDRGRLAGGRRRHLGGGVLRGCSPGGSRPSPRRVACRQRRPGDDRQPVGDRPDRIGRCGRHDRRSDLDGRDRCDEHVHRDRVRRGHRAQRAVADGGPAGEPTRPGVLPTAVPAEQTE